MDQIKKEIEKYNKPIKVVYENTHTNKFERGNEYMSSRYSKHRSLKEKESKYNISEAEDAKDDDQIKEKKTNVNWK